MGSADLGGAGEAGHAEGVGGSDLCVGARRVLRRAEAVRLKVWEKRGGGRRVKRRPLRRCGKSAWKSQSKIKDLQPLRKRGSPPYVASKL